MTNLTELQQRIRDSLQDSPVPLGPAAIAKELNEDRRKIHYNLVKLKEEGLVFCPIDGKYSVNKEEMEILRELENKILNLLVIKEYYPKELEEELDQDESMVASALTLLELDGLVKEGNISLSERGGVEKEGPTVYVRDYRRSSTYTPTHLGYSKMGYCPICEKKMADYERVVIAFFARIGHMEKKTWISAKVHSKCLSEHKSYEKVYGKHESSMFCYHCGLPLTPKILPAYPINYKVLNDHFFSFELESIRLLEGLRQSWIVPFNNPISEEKHVIRPDNSTIRDVYSKLGLEVPEWLDKGLKEDENNREADSCENTSWKISGDFQHIFRKDLSNLENAEKFQKLLIKYRSSFPENYDVYSRTKEIWKAAQEIKKIYDEDIRKSYEELLGPEAKLYAHIDWAFDSNEYDFDRARISRSLNKHYPSTFAQTFAVKCGDQYYHPYCADKLGLNDNHCNDNKATGGGKK